MRYGDLVQFEPITTVIQLQEADREQQARQLVETYVVSDHMAQQLTGIVFPQLQFARPVDNKGLLVVGNYGTGKSHLMAVVSAIAEYEGLAGSLANADVRAAAEDVAGKFRVLRVEIGAVKRDLRDIVLDELEQALARWGIEHTFPASTQVTNNKDALIAAMQKFQEKHPDHGLLLVIDELLDYLRARDDHQIILDLGFLRELGELPLTTRFRFMGGLQESLFESPRFEFVSESLRRVRDRFDQVRIGRQDIAFVVANRLLKKSDEQIARITAHLQPFAPLYDGMPERMGEFARMFPIHPAYVETFEAVHVAEKREVLRTLSNAMTALIEQPVPAEQPGLLSYDGYWPVLRDNATMKANPDVGEVIDKSGVLERKVEHSFTRPALQPMAQRIIHGLSVLRLTTDGINAPIGATPKDLRDDLALWVQTPEATDEFLLSQVRVALKEIMRTVNGQYISYNEENDQYHIDVSKDIDFDQKIKDRGESLSASHVNAYFYDALGQILGLSQTTYRNVSRLWFHELPWSERKVTRPGYLLFTAPDERSTAQPPRDFYLYVLPPFADRPWAGETQADEVVFRFSGLGQQFEDLMRRYAGARAMANESPSHRATYQGKADAFLREFRRWLEERLYDHLEVTHQGVTEPVKQTLPALGLAPSRDLAEILDGVAAAKLAPIFADRYPEYPAFTRLGTPVTEQARPTTAREAVGAIGGRPWSAQATAVLEGLKLADAERRLRPEESPYGKHFLALLEAKDPNQVVNFGEVLTKVADGVSGPIFRDPRFGLEPEWVAVVLAALAQAGAISLTLDGREAIEAGNIEKAAATPIEALADFRFFKRPKGLPRQLWERIFETLGLLAARLRDANTREAAVVDLQTAIANEQQRVAQLEERKGQGLKVWNESIFTDNFRIRSEGGAVIGIDGAETPLTSTELESGLRNYKRALETLARYNTPGKLQNLSLTPVEVGELRQHRAATERLEGLLDLTGQLAPLTTYLVGAQGNLPHGHPWLGQAEHSRQTLIQEVRRFAKGEDARNAVELRRDLEMLKRDYTASYAELHKRQTLGPEADDRRVRILDDDRLATLRELARVDILEGQAVTSFGNVLGALRTCRGFHEGLLEDSPICPECKLNPAHQANAAPAEERLTAIDLGIDTLLADWRRTLSEELRGASEQRSIGAMQPSERKPIDDFLAQPENATELPDGFVKAVNAALRGIETVTLQEGEVIAALQRGGMPTTRQQFEARLRAFLDEQMRGKDAGATRLVLAGPVAPEDEA